MVPFMNSDENSLREDIQNILVESRIKAACGHLTPLAKDFLRMALEKEPKKRWSCAKLLKHKWIVSNYEDEIEQVTTERAKEVLNNIKKFSKMNRLTRNLTEIMVNLSDDSDYIKELTKLFMNIATDGTITVNDIMRFENLKVTSSMAKVGNLISGN